MSTTEPVTTRLSPERWATDLVAHSLAYGFLSRAIYQEPDGGLLRTLADDDVAATWPVEGDDTDLAVGRELLHGFLREWSEELLPELRRDYTRLFIGPGIKAAPWESVYLSRDNVVFEQQTVAVRDFYHRFGLQAPRLRREPDDHLGLELAFMVHLCSLALEALESEDQRRFQWLLGAQRTFLRVHLLRWAPRCLGLVIQHAATDYYRGVGHLALGTLRRTAETLGIDPAEHAPSVR